MASPVEASALHTALRPIALRPRLLLGTILVLLLVGVRLTVLALPGPPDGAPEGSWGPAQLGADLVESAMSLTAALLLLAAALRVRRHQGRARGWFLIALAAACWMVADLAYAYLELVLGIRPYVSWPDYFKLSFYPLFLAGVVLLPRHPFSRSERFKVALDCGIVLCSALVVVWSGLLQPVLTQSRLGGNPLALVTSLVYPVADLLLLWALVGLLSIRREPVSAGALRLFALGAALMLVADACYSRQLLLGTYNSGNWIGVLWTAALGCLALAGAWMLACPLPEAGQRAVTTTATGARPAATSLLLAYLWLTGAWITVLAHGLDGPLDPRALGLSAILGLVALRQWLGLKDIRRLNTRLHQANTELENRVRQRTDELARSNENLCEEVAERREAESALRASEERLRRLYESPLLGIAFWEASGRITDANDRFLALTGRCRSDLGRGLAWRDLLPAEQAERALGALRAADAQGASTPFETELLRGGSQAVPVLIGGALLEGTGGRSVAFLLDLSERRRLEEQLKRSLRLEAVGKLAGGVAHDFNNLLTVILGHGQLLLERLPEGTPARANAEASVGAAKRAAELTRQLLAFSRQGGGRPRPTDLNQVIGDAEAILRSLVGEQLSLELLQDRAPVTVLADPSQLHQVVLNLVVNARDACQPGGSITVLSARTVLDEDEARRTPPLRPGAFASLTVADTGCGMGPGVRARLFEPFFSTKEAGKGTGLGLATVLTIVHQAGGAIQVESSEGVGSTFRVLLPLHGQASETTPGQTPAAALPGGETVLLVEDDPAVRRVAEEALRARGWTVLAAADGEDALLRRDAHPGRIHLVLSDVRMPGLSGCELVEKLRERDPGLRAVLCSGYGTEAFPRQLQARFLAKPYTPDSLAAAVRAELDRA